MTTMRPLHGLLRSHRWSLSITSVRHASSGQLLRSSWKVEAAAAKLDRDDQLVWSVVLVYLVHFIIFARATSSRARVVVLSEHDDRIESGTAATLVGHTVICAACGGARWFRHGQSRANVARIAALAADEAEGVLCGPGQEGESEGPYMRRYRVDEGIADAALSPLGKEQCEEAAQVWPMPSRTRDTVHTVYRACTVCIGMESSSIVSSYVPVTEMALCHNAML